MIEDEPLGEMSVRLGACRDDVLVIVPAQLTRSGRDRVATSLVVVAAVAIVFTVAAVGRKLVDAGAPAKAVPVTPAVISSSRPAPAPALVVGVRRADARAGPERGRTGGHVRAR